jgi:hypothetical protein
MTNQPDKKHSDRYSAQVETNIDCTYRIAGVQTWRLDFGNYTGLIAENVGYAAIPASIL